MKRKICQDSLGLARRIRSAGIPIYIGEDDGEAPRRPSSGLLVYQVGGVIESRAFDFHGGAGYIVRATITTEVPQFAIAGFGLDLPWKDTVRWLEDPREIGGRSEVYGFGGKEGLEFERNHVLNHFADVRRTWSRGESLSGYLLAIGSEPIPDQFTNGARIPAFLIVYDQLWRDYRSSVSLWKEPTEKAMRRIPSGIPRKSGLLDRPDPGFEHAPEKEVK